ncbi:MAG: LytR C-terminal domain-containing protein [Bacteroidota bacterium]
MPGHRTSPSPAPSPALQNFPSNITRSRFKLAIAAVGITAVSVLLLVLAFGGSGTEALIADGPKERTIQLDVLNGAGESRLAQRLTDYLRSRGFDVVETGNFREELEKTLVIDRAGNKQAALQVAQALGIPEDQIVQKIDKNLFLDVSVFIGKDYRILKPFR